MLATQLVVVYLLYAKVVDALPALLQDTPTSPLGKLIFAVITPVMAWLALKAYNGIKTILPWYDALPAVVHQVLAPLFQFAFGFAFSKLGVPGLADLTDLHGLTPDILNGVFTALAAAGIFRWEKQQAPGDATAKLQQSRESQPLATAAV